jgi:hypothetical protein
LLSDSADRSTLFYLLRIMQDAFVESPSKYAHMHHISQVAVTRTDVF